MLKRVRKNGAFLVRRKEADQPSAEHSEFGSQNDESYAISFRSGLILLIFCYHVCYIHVTPLNQFLEN